jgi:drug/metabolite transporter (DMT)-like permease
MLLLPIVLTSRGLEVVRLPIRYLVVLTLNGLLILAGLSTYIGSIALGTPTAKAVLLVYSYPIFTAFLSTALLRERLKTHNWLALLLGLAGVAIIMEFWNVRGLEQLHAGDMLAISNGFFYAAIIVMGRYTRLGERLYPLVVTSWSFAFGLCWFVLFFNFWIHLISPIQFTLGLDWSLLTWFHVLGLSFIGTTLPYLLLYSGLKQVKAFIASLLLLTEPITVFVLGALTLGEQIHMWQVIGGICILSATLLASRGE